jgi:hypothetical protein
MRTHTLSLVVAFALLSPTAARATVACPESHAQLVGFNNLFAVQGPVLDTTYTTSHAGFDLPAGTVAVSRAVGGVNWTRSIATDDFDVTGVAPGTPVAVIAEFEVDGYVSSPGCGGSGCGGYFQASLTQGANSNAQQVTLPNPFAGGQVNLTQTLTLPVTITAGSPLTIAFELAVFVPAGGNAGGSGNGTIRFSGLPPGANVVSCQGFGSATTPARSTSWGRLKTHHR